MSARGARGARNRVLAALALPALLALGGCADADAAAPRVGPATTVAGSGASNPTVAVDSASGQGYVAWVGTAGGAHDVYLARAERGAARFSEPVRVNDRRGDAAPHEQAPAQVAVGPDRAVYVLWQSSTPVPGRRFPASDLRLAVSRDGGRTFGRAVTVNDDAGGLPSSHSFHDLAVGPDGAVYASWIDARARDSARAEGRAEDELPGPEIRVARSTDGGRSFGPSVVVDTGSCPCCRSSLALGPDGSVYVAWRKVFPGEVRDVVVARAEPGTLRFAAPVRVHEDAWAFPGCPHAGPSVGVSADGRVHVAWYTGREGRQGLWYASSADSGTSFGLPAALLTGGWVPPAQAQLAASGAPDGEVWLAWGDRRETQPERTLARASAGAAPRALRGAARPGRSPALDAAGGAGLVAWLERDAVRAQWIGRGGLRSPGR